MQTTYRRNSKDKLLFYIVSCMEEQMIINNSTDHSTDIARICVNDLYSRVFVCNSFSENEML